MKLNDLFQEAHRIGTALWKSSIPQKYKHLPIIGQGATSIVLDNGNDTVIMLTRDAMKKDWLIHDWGLGLGDWIDTFDAYHQKNRDLSDMPVYVIKLPKLFPLSNQNKKIIKKSIEDYNKIMFWIKKQDSMQKFEEYLEKHPNGLFKELVEFLQNYEPEQYQVDFLTKNFMQDKNGKIILIDPIVSTEIMDALKNIKNYKYNYR